MADATPAAAPEAELIRRTLAGEREAFSDLVRLHQAQVRGTIHRYVLDSDVVDDLAQDTFVKAYTQLASYKGKAPFGGWLLSIARNAALHFLRDRIVRRAQGSEALEATADRWLVTALESASEAPEEQDRQLAALETCIQGSSGLGADLVREYYFKNRKAAEIARTLGRSEGSVWVGLLRVRQALRQCVERKLAVSGAAR